MTGDSVRDWVPSVAGGRRRYHAGRVVFWAIFVLTVACLIGGLAGLVLTGPDYRVPGTSMEPAIQPGDRIFVARGQDLRRGDIVVLDIPPGTGGIAPGLYVKRLIGLPGDRVACCDAAGDVSVDGKALNENRYLYPGDAPSRSPFKVTLYPGTIWVLGDQRAISLDSRYWGAVPERDVVGRVYMIAHGTRFTAVSAPSTFVADGLAPAGGRVAWPLVFAGVSGASVIAVIILGAFGITRRAIRGRRERRWSRAAAPPGAVP